MLDLNTIHHTVLWDGYLINHLANIQQAKERLVNKRAPKPDTSHDHKDPGYSLVVFTPASAASIPTWWHAKPSASGINRQ
jgi:hypothetical protein